MFIDNTDHQVLEVESKLDREIWLDSWAPVFEVTPVNPSSPHIRDQARLRRIGEFVLTAVNHRAQIFRRSERQVDRSGDQICVTYSEDASTLYEFENGVTYLPPRTLHIMDYAHPSQGIHYEGAVYGILFPRCLVGVQPNKTRPVLSLTPNSPLGRVIYPLYHNIRNDAFDGATDDVELQVRRLAQLLGILLGSGLPTESQVQLLRKAQLDAIKLYIDKKLNDFEFRPNRIYQKFGVSRSTLYRMFEPYGGVRKYIQTRRTQRAVLDLTLQPYSRGSISQVSDRWGFSSESNFSRAVRQTFGVSPGSLAGSGTKPTPEDRSALNLGAWLARGSAGQCTR